MRISILHLFLVLLILEEHVQSYNQCKESNCGDGPVIRFPFRLKGKQPKRCGYPGFDLSCTSKNDTLMELPNSVKLFVKSIDYSSQVVNVSDPNKCLPQKALNFFSSSPSFPFQFAETDLEDYSLFNCTSSVERLNSYFPWHCLDVPGYEVHVTGADYYISDYYMVGPLVSCTKMYNILSVPFDTFLRHKVDSFQLTWNQPSCGLCEAKGGRCQLKTAHRSSTQVETACFNMSSGMIIVLGKRGCASSKLAVAGSTIGSSILLVLFIAAYHFYTSDKKRKENEARIEKFLEDYEALTPTRYSYADLKRVTNQFKDKLGEGAYGTVFKGKLSNEIHVAVKILNNTDGNGEEFINEVATMGRIHHVNVVRLVGFCAEGFHRALVFEFLPNESLEKFIISNDIDNHNSLGWKKLEDITLGIAKGIEYLHQGCEQRILHFDIKPHNILLDANFVPKISDFGLAKLCSKDQSAISMTTARGTMGYIAPEVFSRNFGNVSYKSDVYSFGMMLLEMVGGRKNTNNNNNNVEQTNEVGFHEWIYNCLDRGEELRIRIEEEGDAKIIKKLTIVGLWCVQWFPVDRPSMTNVVQMLEGEGDDQLPMPPNPSASSGLMKVNAAGRRLHQELPIISEIE